MKFSLLLAILFFGVAAAILDKDYKYFEDFLDFNSKLKYFGSHKTKTLHVPNVDVMNLNDSGFIVKCKNTGRVEIYPNEVVSPAEKVLIEYSIAEKGQNIARFDFTTDFQNQTAFVVAHTPKPKTAPKTSWSLLKDNVSYRTRYFLQKNFGVDKVSSQEFYNKQYIDDSKTTRQIQFGYKRISNDAIEPYNPAEAFNDHLPEDFKTTIISLPNISWLLWNNGYDFLQIVHDGYGEWKGVSLESMSLTRYMETANTLTKLGEFLIQKQDINQHIEIKSWQYDTKGYELQGYNITDKVYPSAFEYAVYNDNIKGVSYMIEYGRQRPDPKFDYNEPISNRIRELIARI